jgi:hypothetical protein
LLTTSLVLTTIVTSVCHPVPNLVVCREFSVVACQVAIA